MANQVWPSALPRDMDTSSFNESPPSTTIRTEMDTGPAKVRQRFTAAPRPIKGDILMTDAQVEIFDQFYNQTIAGGSLPFEFTHPRTRQTVVVRFVNRPTYKPNAGSDTFYLVTLDLEVLP